VLRLIEEFRGRAAGDPTAPLARARATSPVAFEALVREVEWTMILMPLPRVQALPGGEAVWIEPNDRYQVMASRAFEEAVVGMFGEDAVQVKSDNSLPERAQRRWEKRGGGGDDE
jgi:hypothetical protein